jgi:hypothetical protein
MGTEKPKADLLPGTLDMLVLKILMRGHLHGYAIAQLIQQLSDDLLRVEEGSLPTGRSRELTGTPGVEKSLNGFYAEIFTSQAMPSAYRIAKCVSGKAPATARAMSYSCRRAASGSIRDARLAGA